MLSAIFPFSLGKYRVEAGQGAAGSARGLALRRQVFRHNQSDDLDRFDEGSLHASIVDLQSDVVVCSYRLAIMPAAEIAKSYSAQFYGLDRLSEFPAKVMELGRFAIHPDWHDPDILRLAWAGLARVVDAHQIGLLFGCSSFAGNDVAMHRPALAWLAENHLPPLRWKPDRIAPSAHFVGETAKPDPRLALKLMPPLLRSYLAMGGWVSDHAVSDPDLDTLHVFTALEIAAIPPARARALREIAASAN